MLFGALYGEPVEVLKPQNFVFRPSDADYRVTKDLVVEAIDGDPSQLLNLAAIDALVEPLVNGFWFYLLFEVFNKYKKTIYESRSGKSSKNPSPSATRTSKLAPINNKKDLD